MFSEVPMYMPCERCRMVLHLIRSMLPYSIFITSLRPRDTTSARSWNLHRVLACRIPAQPAADIESPKNDSNRPAMTSSFDGPLPFLNSPITPAKNTNRSTAPIDPNPTPTGQ